MSEFARRAGVVPSVAFAWEHGQTHPSLPRMLAVVRALRAGQEVGWRLVVAAGDARRAAL